MMGLLKDTPTWFLLIVIFLMGVLLTAFGGYCTWSIKNIFTDLKHSIEDLRQLISKLFDKHDNHEERLSRLEGKCSASKCGRGE